MYFYSLFLTLVLSAFFPTHGLHCFIPAMIFSFYKHSLQTCLWWAFAIGFTLDLLSSETKLGFYGLNYCLATLILHRYKYQFFEDHLSTLPMMTFIFSFVLTLLSALLYSTVVASLPFSLRWFLHDLIWMPLSDALYAIIAFTIPQLCLSSSKLKRWWWRKKRSLTLLFTYRS